jgi:hypothetical protein
MGQNVEWKYGKKNMCKYFWFFNVEKMVKNVENVRGNVNIQNDIIFLKK